jgi:5'-nucleotidase
MQLSSLLTLACATSASAKNILLTNDDGWLSTGIRATYRELTKAGHNVYLVAPSEQRSGYGGTFMYTYANTLFHDDQFHYKKAGDPAWGHESFDDHIWYFNATPAACVAFAFDYLLPNYFANASIDLVVSGPNQGWNADDFYTLSGTVGASYNAVYRGYPAVAFSGANTNNSFYKDSLNDKPTDVQNIYASKVVELVDTLFASQGENKRTLPLGVGMNVNFPYVSTDSKTGCMNPGYTFARLTGTDAVTAGLKYNSTSNLFGWAQLAAPGVAVTYNGDSSLPSEDLVLERNCLSSVSAFSVDYTAPTVPQAQVKGLIKDLLVGL